MYELNWTSVDFSDNFILNKKNELSSEHDCVIKEAMVKQLFLFWLEC